MNDDGVRVTRIDWLAAVPSLRLFEAIRLAVSLRVLIPVFLLLGLASVAMPLPGSKFREAEGSTAAQSLQRMSNSELAVYLDTIRESITLILTGSVSKVSVSIVSLELWMLLVGFCGVAVIRSAGCRFCLGTGPGVIASARSSLQSRKAIFISALLCGILLGLCCGTFRFLCWTGERTHVGITGLASLACLVVCLVLGTGWLLSLAAIAIDRCDGAEALSRGICYVLSRWQRLLVYATTCWLILLLSDLVVFWLWGNVQLLASAMQEHSDSVMAQESHALLQKSLDFFRDVFRTSIFFCEIAIVYVLLRRIEDGVSLQEIDGGRPQVS